MHCNVSQNYDLLEFAFVYDILEPYRLAVAKFLMLIVRKSFIGILQVFSVFIQILKKLKLQIRFFLLLRMDTSNTLKFFWKLPRYRQRMISHFVASNEHAAEVIGRKGWKIKHIAQHTNTKIKCPTHGKPPVFHIFGQKMNALKAKRMITAWANNFDQMKSKKRNIRCLPGEIVDTVLLNSKDVAATIGRKGKQVKKIAEIADVAIVSPDTNKEPIFIVSGSKTKVETAIFWIKLTAFCSNESNHFTQQDILVIRNILLNFKEENEGKQLLMNTGKVINLGKLKEKFPLLIASEKHAQPLTNTVASYYCWSCKQTKNRVARALCAHEICCDLCVVELFKDFYLQCRICKLKIENFLIETYN